MSTSACGVDGCRVHVKHTHGLPEETIDALLPLDASDPWLRVGMGGRLPGPSQASLGSPDWVASFAAAHPMGRDGYQYTQATPYRAITIAEMTAAMADFDRQCSTAEVLATRPLPSWAATFTGATSSMPGCDAPHGSGLDALLAPGRALDREQERLAKDEADDDTATRRKAALQRRGQG